MNLSYLTASGKIADSASVERFLEAEFSPLAEDLGKLTVSVVDKKTSTGQQSRKSDNEGKTSR